MNGVRPDFSGVTNPKRVIAKREAAAEGEAVARELTEPEARSARFGKQWSPEDRVKHAAALAKKLREQ